MANHTTRVGTKAERTKISDHPHTQYFDDGVPVLSRTPRGNIIEKYVEETVLCCPSCEQEGEYVDEKEPICAACGIILSGDGVPRTRDGSPLLCDAKAAGRIDTDTAQL